MNIVILTNDSLMAKYVSNKLSQTLPIKKVFIEEKKQLISKKRAFLERFFGKTFTKFLLDLKKDPIIRYDEKIEIEKREHYFQDFQHYSQKFFMQSDTINLATQKEKLIAEDIDILLLFGTSIIKEDILQIPAIATLNFHSSLLPYYKGSRVEFWQLYYEDYQYCGATIHMVDSGVDSGNILIQEKIDVEDGDLFWDLRYKNILKGLSIYPQAVALVENGSKGIQQEKISQKVFLGRMITKEKLKELYQKRGYNV